MSDDQVIYTPELAGSGQFGICAECGLPPSPEGHDGCLGELNPKIVMNACCGHGNISGAYLQYWDGSAIRGKQALVDMQILKIAR